MRSTLGGAAARALSILGVAFVVGCGDEAEDFGIQLATPPPPTAVPTGTAAGEAAPRKAMPEVAFSETDFMESDQSRDPFRDYGHLFASRGPGRQNIQRNIKAPMFSLDELKLTGILGRGRSAVMLTDPNGFGWVIYTGEYVGKPELVSAGGAEGSEVAINWRIDRIRSDKADVVFIREDPAHPDIPPSTRIVPLYPPSDDER